MTVVSAMAGSGYDVDLPEVRSWMLAGWASSSPLSRAWWASCTCGRARMSQMRRAGKLGRAGAGRDALSGENSRGESVFGISAVGCLPGLRTSSPQTSASLAAARRLLRRRAGRRPHAAGTAAEDDEGDGRDRGLMEAVMEQGGRANLSKLK